MRDGHLFADIDAIQANLVSYFRLFFGLPGIIARDDTMTWCVSPQGAPGNYVLRTRLPDTDVEAQIDQVLAQLGQVTDQIDWLVFPGCQPTNLGQRLAARGMRAGLAGTWMAADLTTLPHHTPPDGLWITRVHDLAELRAWQAVSADGFGGDTQNYEAYARHGFGPEAHMLTYIGRMAGEPVVSASLLLAGGIAGIYDLSTPPRFRRRGLGRAITAALAAEARQRGYRHAWIWSSEMGKRVYERVGFRAADFGVREFRWLRSQPALPA
jgi:GNAT superfamily N-acetyltransferase